MNLVRTLVFILSIALGLSSAVALESANSQPNYQNALPAFEYALKVYKEVKKELEAINELPTEEEQRATLIEKKVLLKTKLAEAKLQLETANEHLGCNIYTYMY